MQAVKVEHSPMVWLCCCRLPGAAGGAGALPHRLPDEAAVGEPGSRGEPGTETRQVWPGADRLVQSAGAAGQSALSSWAAHQGPLCLRTRAAPPTMAVRGTEREPRRCRVDGIGRRSACWKLQFWFHQDIFFYFFYFFFTSWTHWLCIKNQATEGAHNIISQMGLISGGVGRWARQGNDSKESSDWALVPKKIPIRL